MVSRLPSLTTEKLWVYSIPLLIFFLISTSPITPNDFWWHLRAGQDLVTAGRIPSVDAYSSVMRGTAYPNYASYWLMEGAFYLIYEAGGPQLVLLFRSVIITLSYTLLMVLCWQVSKNWRVAAASTVFAAAIGLYAWAVRPQLIAVLLYVLTLGAIYACRSRPRVWMVLIFPLLMLVWVNSHGSFILELLLLFVWLAAEAFQVAMDRLAGRVQAHANSLWAPALAFLTTLLASGLNPRGFASIRYVIDLASQPVIKSMVPEWAPTSVHTSYGVIFLAGLLFAGILLAVSPLRPSPFSLMTYVVFAGLALATTRGIVWFGLGMAPVVAQHLAAVVEQIRAMRANDQTLSEPNRRVKGGKAIRPGIVIANYAWLSFLVVATFLALPWFKQILPLPASRTSVISPETPVEATKFLLSKRPPGPIFNDLVFGSYLIWAAQPDYPVFADPRLELYPLSIWRDYLLISAGAPGWQQALDSYGVNTLLINPSQQTGLLDTTRQSEQWRQVYQDQGAVIFVRLPSPPCPTAENLDYCKALP